MARFFQNIFKNVARIFSGKNLLWFLLAITLTFVCVASGFDWKYFELTRNSTLHSFFWPAVPLGAILPLFGIFLFWAVSSWKKNQRLSNLALALGQAAILAWLTSTFFKLFTGRPGPPDIFGLEVMTDTSNIFRFGLYQGGIFFGWPSSHTAVAFAMAAALIALYPKNKIIKYGAAIYAFYIGLGISVTIHWFSDFVAGAIVGAVIGIVVGKSFRK